MLRTLVLALVVASLAWAQTPGRTGVIRGIVVAQENNQPVRKAGVYLTLNATPQQNAVAVTDASGRFQFEGLPAGTYEIRAGKEGHGTAVWGSERPGELARFLLLKDGETRDDIRLALVRPSVISGVVRDDSGDPIQGATVTASVEGYLRGTRDLVQRWTAQTDDQGRYRISNLLPGRLYVAATAESRGYLPLTTLSEKQFLGGQVDWRKAAPLVVKSGNIIRNADFRLSFVPYVSIQGRVNGPPLQALHSSDSGIPGSTPSLYVMLEARSTEPYAVEGGHSFIGTGPPNYEFRHERLRPGRYRLTASLMNGGRLWFANTVVTAQSSIEGVALDLAPAPSLKGTIRWEGDATGKPSQFTISLTSPEPGGMLPPSIQTKPDGSFVFEQLRPGIWDIGVNPIPRGAYLKSMILDTQDVLAEEMVITPQTNAPLNIVISTRGAVVEGKLEASQRRLAILLAPVGKFSRVMSWYATAATDAEGKFRMQGLHPGQYKIFAFDQMPPTEFWNPDLIAKLGAHGQALDIAEGATVTASPHIITSAEIKEVIP